MQTQQDERLKIERDGSPYGTRLITQTPFKEGQLIYAIIGYRIVRSPTVHTLQIGPEAHLDDLGILAYLNHSCQPNVLVNTSTLTVYAACDITPGEELTYFYPSTEWEMTQPFVCLCNAPACLRLVTGARDLSEDILGQYFINRHIHAMKRTCR